MTHQKSKTVRINILSVANSSQSYEEVRDGRTVVVVPSATLPDNIVMNGVKYPADEIGKSFHTLARTPAPYGHPMVDGDYVSAKDPQALNNSYIGAYNDNVRRVDGKVLLDKVIDVEVANQSDRGREVLEAIKANQPIHTSNALICNLRACNDEGVDHEAFNMEFDHDAILLHEDGAATPAQGVGMFVNAAGDKLDVINSAIEWAERDMDWAIDSVLGAVERLERASIVERIKKAVVEAITGATTTTEENEVNTMDDKQLDALNAKLDGMATSIAGLGDVLTNAMTTAMAPVATAVTEIQNAHKADEDKERSELVNKLVKANILDADDDGADVPMKALRNMAAKLPALGDAANLQNNGKGGDADDEFKGIDLNADIDDK